MKKLNEITFKMFNGALSDSASAAHFDKTHGFFSEAGLNHKEVAEFMQKSKLSGTDLNKTFHKSWKTILETSEEVLVIQQLMHYLSTYGTNFSIEAYIPCEELNLPAVELKVRVFTAYTKEELQQKALAMLTSGIALKEETLNDVLYVLDSLNFKFTSNVLDSIRNKEAMCVLSNRFEIYPTNVVEAFRVVFYRATGTTLLIKNKETFNLIQASGYNPEGAFNKIGYENLAKIFNRFKPLFLAFKNTDKSLNRAINKIAKMSKSLHEPMIQNPLNQVTSKELSQNDLHWLDNATPFALFKAMQCVESRAYGKDSFVYRIRNGKSFAARKDSNNQVIEKNSKVLNDYLNQRFSNKFAGKKFFIPEGITYGLPTSEKDFIGNFPYGTRITADKLAAGIYWEDSWGARDLDLSGMGLGHKVGWDARWQADGIIFSGDITSAPNGAVEYLYATGNANEDYLLNVNVFSHSYEYDSGKNVKCKMIVGVGDSIDRKYMMNPNNVIIEAMIDLNERNNSIGVLHNGHDGCHFTLGQFSQGNSITSRNDDKSTISLEAMMQEIQTRIYLNDLIIAMGGEIVTKLDEGVVDLSPSSLEKDTLIKLFN
jgi:hypothetical protein